MRPWTQGPGRKRSGGLYRVTQVNAHRWNHHVEVTSEQTARSDWLRGLMTAGFEFAGR